MKTRTIKLKLTRHEVWFPEYEVPAHLTDEEALELVQSTAPDEVYDEMNHKWTLDTEVWAELYEGTNCGGDVAGS